MRPASANGHSCCIDHRRPYAEPISMRGEAAVEAALPRGTVRRAEEASTRGFYQAANPIHAHCAKDPTNQPTVSGPECAKCGTSQPTSWAGQGPARVAHGSKISSLRVFNTRTSKWVNMGYFTPLQAPRSIFSPLSILKLRHEGHSGLLDALGCQGKAPLRPLRRGRPLTNQHLEAWSAQSAGPTNQPRARSG